MASDKIMDDINHYKKIDKSQNKNLSKQKSIKQSNSKYLESNFYLT